MGSIIPAASFRLLSSHQEWQPHIAPPLHPS